MKFSEIQPKPMADKEGIKSVLLQFVKETNTKFKDDPSSCDTQLYIQNNIGIFTYVDGNNPITRRSIDLSDILFLVLNLGDEEFWIYRNLKGGLRLAGEGSSTYDNILYQHKKLSPGRVDSELRGKSYSIINYKYGKDFLRV